MIKRIKTLLTTVLMSGALLLALSCVSAPEAEAEPVSTGIMIFNRGTDMESIDQLLAARKIPAEDYERYRDVSAITIESGSREQYVFGDNISGYWEGISHSYRRANGYQIAESVVLADIAAAANGSLVNRRIAAEQAVLRPGEIIHEYPGFSEGLYLLGGEHSMALTLESTGEPAYMSFFPAFKTSLNRYQIRIEEGVFLLVPSRTSADYPAVIAVSSSVPMQMAENLAASFGRVTDGGRVSVNGAPSQLTEILADVDVDTLIQSEREIRNAINVSDRSPLLSFTSTEPQLRAEFFVSFGYDEADALERAKRVRDGGIRRHQADTAELSLASRIFFPDVELERALYWSAYSGYTMVTRQYGTGIWAGLPWFRQNWGRDTFIALPGILLTTGRFADARDVLHTFSQFQNLDSADATYGRVPNRVNNPDDIIYNTTDGTPWLIREAEEYMQYSGDLEFAGEILDLARHYIDGALQNFVGDDGLLYHDDADTWMDARINGDAPWSARGNRAVDIQALWYRSLLSAASIARISGEDDLALQWEALAETARSSFSAQFWDGELLADRIRPDDSRDTKARPNQLMAISVPYLGDFSEGQFISPDIQAAVVKNSVDSLLYPHGIASLDPGHPYFHPRHDQTGMFHKDAAYHNGTIWGWNAGPALTAMLKLGAAELSGGLILNLAYQINSLGTLGSMSELVEPLLAEDGSVVPSGTFSQAWSVSEFTRVLHQDVLGFRPRLLEGRVALSPMIPQSILGPGETIDARFSFGDGLALNVTVDQDGANNREYRILLEGGAPLALDFASHNSLRGWQGASFNLTPGEELIIRTAADGSALDGTAWETLFPAFPEMVAGLSFRDPVADGERPYPAMEESNYLKTIIEAGDFR